MSDPAIRAAFAMLCVAVFAGAIGGPVAFGRPYHVAIVFGALVGFVAWLILLLIMTLAWSTPNA